MQKCSFIPIALGTAKTICSFGYPECNKVIALKSAKTLWSFGCPECNRVKTQEFCPMAMLCLACLCICFTELNRKLNVSLCSLHHRRCHLHESNPYISFSAYRIYLAIRWGFSLSRMTKITKSVQ